MIFDLALLLFTIIGCGTPVFLLAREVWKMDRALRRWRRAPAGLDDLVKWNVKRWEDKVKAERIKRSPWDELKCTNQ